MTALGLGILTLGAAVLFPPAAPGLLAATISAGNISTGLGVGAAGLYIAETTFYTPGSDAYNGAIQEALEESISAMLSYYTPKLLQEFNTYFARLGGEFFPMLAQTEEEVTASGKMTKPIADWLGNFLAVLNSKFTD